MSITARMPRPEMGMEAHESEELWRLIGHALKEVDLERLSPDEFVDLAHQISVSLPTHLRQRILTFRRYAPDGDVLLLRGLVPSAATLPPTAASPWGPLTGTAQNSALLLASVTVLLGEPFNYSSLYEGRLVQSMVPRRSMEYTQTSQSSSGMLDWHCEDSYREDRCDYVGLLCLRGDQAAASKYAQARDVKLTKNEMATLREPRYQARPDPAHTLPDKMPPRRLAIFSGPTFAPEIAYDTHHITPIDDADTDASQALCALAESLDEAAITYVMRKGDLLLFDNKRVVHARTPFAARFDGTDRWLMRTMLCGSTVTFRRWGKRVPE